MIRTYLDLTEDALAPIPFDDASQALHLLRDLAGHDVADSTFERLLASLIPSLEANADPTRALVNFATWLERAGSRAMYYDLFATHHAVLASLLTIFGASQFLADLLLGNPEYFEVLANPAIRDRNRTMADFLADARRRIAVAKTLGMKRDALRRFKPPEVLRIGARDLLGYATVEETVSEISDFAEACVRVALEISEIDRGFAVIAMGKLGGRELNYASDIDLIFVHDDTLAQPEAIKMAEAVRDTLAHATPAGFVFRVDLRLRPEGRFGPISRSISACRAYYESWAETWERQALLKARLVAGDERVGGEFLRIAEKFVFAKHVQAEFVEEIRANKRMLERQTARHEEALTNVKQGIGGIRDVEFAVQLLQLLAGGKHPELRTGNTIDALSRLAAHGLISGDERQLLAESYLFLRNVEHRLQILDERPVRNIPVANSLELTKFARRLSYPSGDAFMEDYRRHTVRVHRLFKEIFDGGAGDGSPAASIELADGDETRDLLHTIRDPASEQALQEILRSYGFRNVHDALEILRRSTLGTNYGEFIPAAREGFIQIAPALLESASASGDPDEALRGMDRLAEAAPSRAALYRSLADEPEMLRRLSLFAAKAPFLWEVILGHMEYLDLLSDDGEVERAVAPPEFAGENTARDLASYIRRERLRIGARDLWEITTTQEVTEDITRLAEETLAFALRMPGYEDVAQSLAIVGMGKLGGRELGYGSDLDVLWVLEEGGDYGRAGQLATAITSLLTEGMKAHGIHWETDARLRPDGRVGSLVRTVSDYEAYYVGGGADAWEFQALIKARAVAGNPDVGAAFEELAERLVYAAPIKPDQIASMRHMKGRIERERCKDRRDLKLGPGGLSDVEWVAQLLQWRHGLRWRKARTPNTLAALSALRDAGMLRQDDWETLSETYVTLTRTRNRLWLRDGRGTDVDASLPESLSDQRTRVREAFERLFLRD
ncbi:MAG: hypothetical protein P4L33_16845 [Capsulimonadaceae bacterium]|nr:hypothetical protein [Capsulimonadaceae bacterium]